VTYTIPPRTHTPRPAGTRAEIWALGVRNPWRFSFDRQTGDLYVGDVGQGAWEEVDYQPASSAGGENYGWNILEGTHCYPPSVTTCTPPAHYAPPVHEYSHSDGCSIARGFVYRGSSTHACRASTSTATRAAAGFLGPPPRRLDLGEQPCLYTLSAPSYNITTFGEDRGWQPVRGGLCQRPRRPGRSIQMPAATSTETARVDVQDVMLPAAAWGTKKTWCMTST